MVEFDDEVEFYDGGSFTRLAWKNAKTERRPTGRYGDGLYATEQIRQGELIAVWGGIIVTTAELRGLTSTMRDRVIQVDVDHHLCSGPIDDDADSVNHSCEPNAGMRGQISLVAMRDIDAGEQICFDYAMSDAHPDFLLDCACGAANCRGKVAGDDWMNRELRERYRGYFSPYIQVLIDGVEAT